MASIIRHYKRGRHPKGFWGRRTLLAMNGKKHAALPEWVFSELKIPENSRILDVGCGGGANIGRMLKLYPGCRATGLDISAMALEMTTDKNYPAVVDGDCTVMGGNAIQMPIAKCVIDVATAFEAIYYWLSIDSGFSEIYRVLKPGGMVVIANELDGLDPNHDPMSKAVGGMRIYTPDEIKLSLKDAGFTDIKVRQDEQRHFVCVTAKKQT